MKKSIAFLFAFLTVTAMLLSACTSANSTENTAPADDQAPQAESAPAEEQAPPAESDEVAADNAEAAAPPEAQNETPETSGLPADPQRISFLSGDGVTSLVGYYYPSKYANAPIIILMHWAGGNQRDWCKIAPWLQNRQDENPSLMPDCEETIAAYSLPFPPTWWDESWFPPMPEDASYAVFTFDFASYGESETGSGRENVQDAIGAFTAAAALEGIDSNRIVSAGSSIGADGAPDGCFYHNEANGSGCLGAFSWSPGNYLGELYPEIVHNLAQQEPPVPVWCLAGEEDAEAAPTCDMASLDLTENYIYLGKSEHGNMLIAPELTPPDVDKNSLELLIDFLGSTVPFP